MAEDTATAAQVAALAPVSNAQAATDTQPPAGTSPDPNDAPDVDVLQEKLSKAGRENQNLRRRLKELEDAAKPTTTAPDPAHAALQAAQDRAAQAEAALQAERTQRAAERAAGEGAAVYPDLVARLLLSDLELDEAGQPINEKTLLAAARRRYPLLFRTVSADGGARGAATTGQDMNSMIRQMAGRG